MTEKIRRQDIEERAKDSVISPALVEAVRAPSFCNGEVR
jgi:hypothetical protein